MSSVPVVGVNPGSLVPSCVAPGTHQLPLSFIFSPVEYGCPGHLPPSRMLARIREDSGIEGHFQELLVPTQSVLDLVFQSWSMTVPESRLGGCINNDNSN